MQPTRIEFDMTREHMTAAARVLASQDRAIQRAQVEARWVALILIGVGLLTGGGLIYFEPPPVWIGLALGVLLVLLGLASWPTQKKLNYSTGAYLEKVTGDPAWRKALGWRAFELHPDCLLVDAGWGRSQVLWRAVVRTHLDDNYLTLILPGPELLPIPRTEFETDADFDKFVDEVYRLIEADGGNTGDSPPDDPDDAVPE